MVQIKWTNLAVFDLKEIYEYIARDSKKYAQLQVIKIKARTNILKKNLLAGKVNPELSNPDFRELVEGNYRIIYKVVSPERVDILTVHHSARDLTRRSL
ncbi:MAG: type II toxin-antitoxin system RelE/ParE family toxin [Cytophagia bacterium]|nr:type II toxin-antitoxin system RelE/ParE family toxin [Cytophagia bacterium]